MTTKTRTPSAELKKLERARTNSYAELQQVKRARSGWDDQSHTLRAEYSAFVADRPEDWEDASTQRPRPGSESAKMAEKVKARLAETNPHDADFVSARAKFHKADEALNEFLQTRFFDLLDEDLADFAAVEEKFRLGFSTLVEAADEYEGLVDRARGLVNATPGIDGQALTHDPRPHLWKVQALEVLEAGLAQPGITEPAAWKLGQQHG